MAARKRYGPLTNKEHGTLNLETAEFIRYYANKWRRKSIFQVLLQYRAAKYQDLFNFSQQVTKLLQSVEENNNCGVSRFISIIKMLFTFFINLTWK